MIQALIISIIIGIITNAIQGAIGYFKSEKIKSLHKNLLDERIKLANEIRQFQEKQKQIEDMFSFNLNNAEIESKMNLHVKILNEARSKKNVKEELRQISTDIRNIFNN
jgi:predicted transcriptional regulator